MGRFIFFNAGNKNKGNTLKSKIRNIRRNAINQGCFKPVFANIANIAHSPWIELSAEHLNGEAIGLRNKASLPDVATLRVTHTGAGEGTSPPSIPLKNQKEKVMKRDRIIRFRASPEEKAAIVEKALVQSQTLADFLRQRVLN